MWKMGELHIVSIILWPHTADFIKVCRSITTTDTIVKKKKSFPSYWAKCSLISSVCCTAISITRGFYCATLVAVHKLAAEGSVHFRVFMQRRSHGLFLISAATTLLWLMPSPSHHTHMHTKRKVLLNCLLSFCQSNQPVRPNCGASRAWKPFTETVINYPIFLSWNHNRIKAFRL